MPTNKHNVVGNDDILTGGQKTVSVIASFVLCAVAAASALLGLRDQEQWVVYRAVLWGVISLTGLGLGIYYLTAAAPRKKMIWVPVFFAAAMLAIGILGFIERN